MEKNYMSANALVEFEFLKEKTAREHTHENPELLFVLEGKLKVKTDQREYPLSAEDFLLVNANRTHSYESEGTLLAVRFLISATKLKELLNQNSILFWCSSVPDNTPACEEVRKILKDILLGSVNRSGKDVFYINALHYQLLSTLCGNFLLEQSQVRTGKDKEKERMEQILEYIRLNYREPISLQDVADALFLSPTYLSKYIRKSSGKGFVDLISSIRLTHAVEDLLYTENSVTRVAMDNGFSSVAALNKVFREVYDTTPSEYRKDKKGEKGELTESPDEENLRKTAVYLHRHYQFDQNAREKNEAFLTLPLKEETGALLRPVVNVGKAATLGTASVQRLIKKMKEETGASYVRFSNIFEPEMYLGREERKGNLNFGKLDEILDFLVSEGLCPYFELRSKDLRVFSSVNAPLRRLDQTDAFSDAAERLRFFEKLTAHLARRFGPAEVGKWIFDYEIPSDTAFQDGQFVFHPVTDEKWTRYLDEYEQITGVIKSRFPDAKCGGAGFPVQHFGTDKLKTLFLQWRERKQRPDFISFTSFPYQIVEENGSWYEKRRTHFGFVKEDADSVLNAAYSAGFTGCEFHLTEYNLTLSDRNFINDSAVRAAFTAAVFAQLNDKIHLFGIWNAGDAFADLADTPSYLFGGSGILTKIGAAKPAFTVLTFINRLYREHVSVSEGCVVTSNRHGHYRILAQHSVNMNTAYYLKDEQDVPATEVDRMSETDLGRTIHVKMQGMKEGSWQIRRYCLHRNAGSVLDEWLNLGLEAELSYEELKYLERISIPRLFVERMTVKDGNLEFDIDLEPNEVQYLHITEYS